MPEKWVSAVFGCIRCRIIGVFNFAHPDDGVYFGNSAHSLRPFLWTMMEGGIKMRVVVVKSPRLVSGLLRCLFGIKKDVYTY